MAGGYLAQLTNLGVPYLVRAGVLVVMFVVAHDASCTTSASPRTAVSGRWRRCKLIVRSSVDNGLKVPPIRATMLAGVFSGGVGIYVFYALQPYLLDLWGDPTAYGIAGLVAAIVAGAQIVGGLLTPKIRIAVPPADLGAAVAPGRRRRTARAHRPGRQLLDGRRAGRDLGAERLGRPTDPAGRT